MRRRSADTSDGSLDLLLDTICNTFGGILFISLLVVVLLNTTSESILQTPPAAASQLQLLQLESERQELVDELHRLRNAVAQHEAISADVFSDELIAAAEQLKQKKTNLARLVAAKSEAVGVVSRLQVELNRLAQQSADRGAKLAAAQQQAAALEATFKQLVAERSKTAVIPKISQVERLGSVICFLKGGKLYGPHDFANGAMNTADFVAIDVGGNVQVDVNPSGGVVIDPSISGVEAASSKLASIDPASYYVRIFVWPDSYEHFEAVREAITSLGLKYDLKPCEADSIITFGPPSSGPSTVQN